MVRLRFARTGRRNRPFYRLHAVDSRARRDGRFIEQLGWYDPLAAEGKQMQLNEERIKYWVGVGAQPSETVRDFLAKRNLIDTKEWEADRAAARKLVEDRKAAEAATAAAAAAPAEGEAAAG